MATFGIRFDYHCSVNFLWFFHPGPYPPLTALNGVAGRGKKIVEQKCAFCHNTNGQGRYDNDTYYRPALWGKQSFNPLAGLAHPQKLAEFIHSNMPLDFGGNLTEQEAWDLAAFIDSQDRPSKIEVTH